MERLQERFEDEALRMKLPAKDWRLPKAPKAQPSAEYSEDNVRKAEVAFQQWLKEEEEQIKEEVKKKGKGKKKNAKAHGDNESFHCGPFEHTASEPGRSPHWQKEEEEEATSARWDSTDDRSERGQLEIVKRTKTPNWLLLNEVQGRLEGGREGGDEGSLAKAPPPFSVRAGFDACRVCLWQRIASHYTGRANVHVCPREHLSDLCS